MVSVIPVAFAGTERNPSGRIRSRVNQTGGNQPEDPRIPVILDTDANNELDDQHALAYLLLNENVFDVAGITVNATRAGGPVENHRKEAQRVVDLVGWHDRVKVYSGANGTFPEIKGSFNRPGYDGEEAVEFIIRESMKEREAPLVVIPVGKLTNVALALAKKPEIAGRIRVVWLGSNYPEPGEYNQDNDTAAMNFVLGTKVPFEMVTVRSGKQTGTAAVRAKRKDIYTRMPGMGPSVEMAVEGRHGGTFHCFGDYSVDLFRHIASLDEECYRSLFDLAAVAIVKEPSWAEAKSIPAPLLVNNRWTDRPWNKRTILVWENFHSASILEDLYATLEP